MVIRAVTPRPTPVSLGLKEIARLAGTSVATVSLALRDYPKISAATRERVQAIAQKLGYRPNPHAVYMARLRGGGQAKPVRAAMAFLGPLPFARLDDSFEVASLFRGAALRAEALGYHLDYFNVREPGVTLRRLNQMLVSRGIEGLLVSPMTGLPQWSLALHWQNFAAATVGYTLDTPHLHRACPDYFNATLDITRRLTHAGYRRIGLCIEQTHAQRENFLTESAFLHYQNTLPVAERIPLFVRSSLASSPQLLWAWFRDHRPDAIVAFATDAVQTVLARHGLAVPRDVALVTPYRQPRTLGIAGQDQCLGEVAAGAIDLIVAQIHRSEHGIPARPRTLLVPGEWRDDRSLPVPRLRARGQPLKRAAARTPRVAAAHPPRKKRRRR